MKYFLTVVLILLNKASEQTALLSTHLKQMFKVYETFSATVLSLRLNSLPEKLLVLMVLLEWSELMSHSFSSSEKGESDKGEPLSFGRKGWRTRRGMRLRGLPFSGDFFSCTEQHLSQLQAGFHSSMTKLSSKIHK